MEKRSRIKLMKVAKHLSLQTPVSYWILSREWLDCNFRREVRVCKTDVESRCRVLRLHNWFTPAEEQE